MVPGILGSKCPRRHLGMLTIRCTSCCRIKQGGRSGLRRKVGAKGDTIVSRFGCRLQTFERNRAIHPNHDRRRWSNSIWCTKPSSQLCRSTMVLVLHKLRRRQLPNKRAYKKWPSQRYNPQSLPTGAKAWLWASPRAFNRIHQQGAMHAAGEEVGLTKKWRWIPLARSQRGNLPGTERLGCRWHSLLGITGDSVTGISIRHWKNSSKAKEWMMTMKTETPRAFLDWASVGKN